MSLELHRTVSTKNGKRESINQIHKVTFQKHRQQIRDQLQGWFSKLVYVEGNKFEGSRAFSPQEIGHHKAYKVNRCFAYIFEFPHIVKP